MKWNICIYSVVSQQGYMGERVSGTACDLVDGVEGVAIYWDYGVINGKPHALYLSEGAKLPAYVRSSIVSLARSILAAQKKRVKFTDRRTDA